MASLVFITQEVDPRHPALAATIPKIAALAERFDRVAVLAAGAVPGTLPSNCAVRTFRARTRVGRGARFERALLAELTRHRPRAVLAHMCPIFAVLAAPAARLFRSRVLLWYTHWHADATLRLAARASDAILSVDVRSFPLPSGKVSGIGHGIDVDQFPCRARADRSGIRTLVLGRYSPAKGLDVVLRALRLAVDGGLDVRLDAYGPALAEHERRHRDELEALVADLRLSDRVTLNGPVERAEVPRLLAAADVLVNNMRAGAPDKVVYEAAASCVPVLASNPVFDDFLPESLRFERNDPATLERRLLALAGRDRSEREEIGRALRRRVAESHSVDHWAGRVAEAALG